MSRYCAKVDATRRCRAVVYKRDTYRYTGRGSGFKLHYIRDQCRRRAAIGDLCRQHAGMDGQGQWLLKVKA